MVALNKDNFHHHPGRAGISSDLKCAKAKRGRCQYGKSAQSEKSVDETVSAPSVDSVAGNYPCGIFTGNIPNGTTDYIYMGWSRRAGISAGGALAGERLQQVMEESSTSNTPIRQYVWGTYPGAAALTRPSASTGFRQQNAGLGNVNIDECIQLTTLATLGPQSLPAGAYYLLQDLLYRAVALTNSTGAVVEAYDTDAYGNTLVFTGPGTDGQWFTDDDLQSNCGANEIIYCGYPDGSGFRGLFDASPQCRWPAAPLNRHDPETELCYVRNRTYSLALGRWLQRDPLQYISGANAYQFVMSNPVAKTDASGLGGGFYSFGPPPPFSDPVPPAPPKSAARRSRHS